MDQVSRKQVNKAKAMKERYDTIKAEQLERNKQIVAAAQACYKDPKFKRYADMLLESKNRLIDEIIYYEEPDPVIYAEHMKHVIRGYRMVSELASVVSKEVGKDVSTQEG